MTNIDGVVRMLKKEQLECYYGFAYLALAMIASVLEVKKEIPV